MEGHVVRVSDNSQPHRLGLVLRPVARQDSRLVLVRALRGYVPCLAALEALAVLQCDLGLLALLTRVPLLTAVGACHISLVSRWGTCSVRSRRSSPRGCCQAPLDKGAELFAGHGLHGFQGHGLQGLLVLRHAVEEVSTRCRRPPSIGLREPLRPVLDPLPQDLRLALEFVKLPQHLVADFVGDQAHDGSHLAVLREGSAAGLDVVPQVRVPGHECLVDVSDLRDAMRRQDLVLQREELGLRPLRYLKIHYAPHLKPVFNLHTVEEVPGLVEEVDIEEAPKVVGQHLWVVAQHGQRVNLPHGRRQLHRVDGLDLQLSPPEQVVHIGVLGVEVVRDLLSPDLRLLLAIVARQLVTGRLGVKGRFGGLQQFLVAAVVTEDVVGDRATRGPAAAAAVAAAIRSSAGAAAALVELARVVQERGSSASAAAAAPSSTKAKRLAHGGALGAPRAPLRALAGALADLQHGCLDLAAE